MSRATLISGPATLKFTAGGRKQGKTQKPQDKIPGTPKIWGRNPKTPKVGMVETLFYVAIDVSIDMKRSGGQKGHVHYSRRGLVTIDYRWSHARVNRLKS